MLTATLAAILLFLGSYSAVEKLLTCLVGLMGAAFIVTAIMIGPDIRHLLSGLLSPSLPPHSVLTVVALIGTTVVPYNLFLHASAVQQRWSEELPLGTALRESRWDTGLSIGFGGFITTAATVTAAGLHGDGAAIEGASDMARQLRPCASQTQFRSSRFCAVPGQLQGSGRCASRVFLRVPPADLFATPPQLSCQVSASP